MNTVQFTSSNKKIKNIAMFGIVFLFASITAGFLIPIGDIRNIYLVLTVTSIGLICMYLIKKAKNAYCPKCKVDLYNIIEHAKLNKFNVKYCPSCGAEIEI